MDFDHRRADRLDCIVERDAGVGEGAGVEQHGLGADRLRFVKPINEMAFVVGLAQINLEAQFARAIFEHAGKVIQRGRAVDLRLACSEQVEIGAVEDEDGIRHRALPRRRSLCVRP